MKNLIYLFFGMLLVASCNTDPCKDVVCGDHGACNEGSCLCENGYEQGSNGLCDTEVRAKFAGTWVSSDSCNTGTASYSVTIVPVTADTTLMSVSITNFWNSFTNKIIATVTGSKTINIARQEPDNDKFFVKSIGDATLSGSTMTIKYVVIDETDPNNILADTCTSSWLKQ